MNVKHKIASGLILWYMKAFGFFGWTSFWNTIYYIDNKAMNNKKLQRHELKHIKQINRDGRLLFTFKYLCYSIRYGYIKNPYEVEAREAEETE